MTNNTAFPRPAHVATLVAKSSASARTASNSTPIGATVSATEATGKAFSRARRQALAQRGKLGVIRVTAPVSADIRVAAPAMPASAPTPVEMFASATAQATATRGDCGCGRKSGSITGLSGRDAARARREELCQQGRGDHPACRPSGRVRQKPATPTKVEQGTTLSGTTVTGTQVERSAKVTGAEPGSCRAITGTEYIGAEQYGELCAAIPEPAAAKVSVGSTSRGQRVSGVELGRSVKVTGDEHGACRTVTGTEYLSAEKFESFCATRPVPAPAKVGVATTQAGQRVSGTEVGRSARVTGDEPGSCLKLTGSQYYQPEQFG
ncbi:CsoS2 family carboxysome shell protein, partial [Thiomonas sp.]